MGIMIMELNVMKEKSECYENVEGNSQWGVYGMASEKETRKTKRDQILRYIYFITIHE